MPDAVHDTTEIVAEQTIIGSELESPGWAVISFDRVEGGNLSYREALRLLADLDSNGVAGLCIVTDQTAARLAI